MLFSDLPNNLTNVSFVRSPNLATDSSERPVFE